MYAQKSQLARKCPFSGGKSPPLRALSGLMHTCRMFVDALHGHTSIYDEWSKKFYKNTYHTWRMVGDSLHDTNQTWRMVGNAIHDTNHNTWRMVKDPLPDKYHTWRMVEHAIQEKKLSMTNGWIRSTRHKPYMTDGWRQRTRKHTTHDGWSKTLYTGKSHTWWMVERALQDTYHTCRMVEDALHDTNHPWRMVGDALHGHKPNAHQVPKKIHQCHVV